MTKKAEGWMRVEGRLGETRVEEGSREAMVDDLRRVERNEREKGKPCMRKEGEKMKVEAVEARSEQRKGS